MKTCPKCKTEYTDDKKFCKTCGTSLIAGSRAEPKIQAKKMVLEEKIKLDPLNLTLLTEYARFLTESSLYDEAIVVLYKILAIEEGNLPALQLLFDCLMKTLKINEAIEVGDKLSAIYPNDTDLLNKLAAIAVTKNEDDKALNYFYKITKIKPLEKDAWKNIAALLNKKGNSKDELIAWQKVFEIDPEDNAAKLVIGINAAQTGNYSKALLILKTAANINDIDSGQAYKALICLAYSKLKVNPEEKEITELYDKILLINETESIDDKLKEMLTEVILYLGNNSLEAGNLDEALSLYDEIKKIDCYKNHLTELSLAYSKIHDKYLAKGDLNKARYYISESSSMSPENVEIQQKYSNIENLIILKKKKLQYKILAIAGTIVVLIAAVIIISSLVNSKNDNDAWEKAKQTNTSNSYQTYIADNPEGKHLDEALKLEEISMWNESVASNSIAALDKYISLFNNGAHKEDAIKLRENLFWRDAIGGNSFQSYSNYINNYPNGKNINEANDRRNKLLKNVISVEKIKNDLLGKKLQSWNFDYLSEFKNVEIKDCFYDGNILTLYSDLKLEDYNNKALYYSNIIMQYIMQNDQTWSFLNVRSLYYSTAYNKYRINGKIFIIGKWRWKDNTAEYKSDGTWSGNWDDGTSHSGVWCIMQDEIWIYLEGAGSPWLNGKIINYTNSKIEIEFNGTINRGEKLKQ